MKPSKNYLPFWIGIPVVGIVSLIFKTGYDYALHDTYFVIENNTWLVMSGFLFASGLGYFLLRKRQLNRGLTLAHKVLTFTGLLLYLACISLIVYQMSGYQSYEYLIQNGNINYDIAINIAMTFAVGLVVLGLVCYVINIGVALMNKKDAN